MLQILALFTAESPEAQKLPSFFVECLENHQRLLQWTCTASHSFLGPPFVWGVNVQLNTCILLSCRNVALESSAIGQSLMVLTHACTGPFE